MCVLPLLAIADSSEACLIMTASAEGTMRVSHCGASYRECTQYVPDGNMIKRNSV